MGAGDIDGCAPHNSEDVHTHLSDHKILPRSEANHLPCRSPWDDFPAQFQMQNNAPWKQRESFKLVLTYQKYQNLNRVRLVFINKGNVLLPITFESVSKITYKQYFLSLSVKTSFVILFLLRTILLSWDLSPMGNEWNYLQAPIHILCKISQQILVVK